MEEKENKHPGKLILELSEPGTTFVFLFLRFALINETANSIKYRAMIMYFSSRGTQLGRMNTVTYSVPKLLRYSGDFKKNA